MIKHNNIDVNQALYIAILNSCKYISKATIICMLQFADLFNLNLQKYT